MEASLRKARALRLRFSQSLASRRQRFNQAIVRMLQEKPPPYKTVPLGRVLEERDLVDLFGDDYRRYKDRVSMLVPWRKSA